MFVEKGHLYQLERPRRGRTLACAYHVRPLRGRHNVKKRLFLQRYDLSEVAISFDAFALPNSPYYRTIATGIFLSNKPLSTGDCTPAV